MSIAFDASTRGSTTSGTLSFSHTCTGSDRIIFFCIFNQNNSGLTTIRYNGVDATLVNTVSQESGTRVLSIYRLLAPATGSNTVEIVRSSATGTLACRVLSYNTVSQTGFPDASRNDVTASGTPTVSGSLTTVADNAFVLAFYRNGTAGYSSTTISGGTDRGTVFEAPGYTDSAPAVVEFGPRTPAGSTTITIATAGAVNATHIGLMVSFAPAAAAPTGNRNTGFFMFG